MIHMLREQSDLVTIEIPTGKKFSVHAHLLAYYSEYFRRALNSGMEESNSLYFKLTEHATNESMSFFVTWVYKNQCRNESSATEQAIKQAFETTPEHALDVWLLADYLHAGKFLEYVEHILKLKLKGMDTAACRDFCHDNLKRHVIRANSTMHVTVVEKFAILISDEDFDGDRRRSYFEALDTDTIMNVVDALVRTVRSQKRHPKKRTPSSGLPAVRKITQGRNSRGGKIT